MVERVEQRTGEQQKVRQHAEQVCPVLGQQEERDDGQESEERPAGQAHREDSRIAIVSFRRR
jgi:hypothetical protein